MKSQVVWRPEWKERFGMGFLRRGCFTIAAAALSVPFCLHAANPHGGKVTLPVMTAVTVKLDQAVNTKTIANGSAFTALIKDPVQVDGATVIPANSAAGGLVSSESAAKGELELNSIFVNGRMYRITTTPVPFNQKTNLHVGSTMTFYLVLSLSIAK